MKRVFCVVAVFLLLGAFAKANDGKDRHQSPYATVLYLFPAPHGPQSGYRVLEQDGPGGADGDLAFRWARPEAIALVRVAAFETARQLKPSRYPMAIFDLSAENGDTPVGFESGKPPRGRHPGDSHDGGLNIDLGYYLRSQTGKAFSPDMAACSEHFKGKMPDSSPESYPESYNDAYRCRAAPDRLDVKRQAYFIMQLFKMNRELFDRDLIGEVGIDWQIRKAVNAQIDSWVAKREYHATAEIAADIKRTFNSDAWEGWARSHHHHIHLRLRDLPHNGHYREAFEKLFARERKVDSAAWKKGSQPLFRARLMSVNLERAIDFELLAPSQAKRVLFRVGTGKRQVPDPARGPGPRAVIDLPTRFQALETVEKAAVQVVTVDDRILNASTEVRLPRKEPHLAIRIDPARFESSLERVDKRWRLTLGLPDTFRRYVTEVSFHIHRGGPGGRIEKMTAIAPGYSVTFEDQPKSGSVLFIDVRVELSGRKLVKLPVYP